MIIGERILDDNLIIDGDKANLKNSTYDLTISKIVEPGKAAQSPIIAGTFYLEPRRMAWVFSKESFCLPDHITGVATLRTALTRDGILALNVGILDPLFVGPISTALLNFSDQPRPIAVGEKFFRVAFFEHEKVPENIASPWQITRAKYEEDQVRRLRTEFSQSFMDIDQVERLQFKDFVKRTWRKFRDILPALSIAVTIGALIVGMIAAWLAYDEKLQIDFNIRVIEAPKSSSQQPSDRDTSRDRPRSSN